MTHPSPFPRLARPCLAVLALVPVLALPATTRAEPLTLADALRQAEVGARAVRIKDAEVDKARYEHHATMTDLGPKLNLAADYQHWDSELKFAFKAPDPSTIPPEFSWVTDLFGSGDSVIRARNTWSASVAVVQPITPLVTIGLASHLTSLNVDRARVEALMERRKARLQAIDGFFGVLRARKTVAVLEALDRAVSTHLEQAEQFEKVGLLKKDDVMRVRVQAESLRGNLDMARMSAEVQASSLALLLGRPLGAAIEPVEDAFPADVAEPLDTCLEEAVAHRPELQQVRLAVRMAEAARDIKGTAWLPAVSGLFSYNRATQTQFSKADSWFVGLTAQWTVFDWGRNFLNLKAAGADVAAARHAAAQVEDLVRLEVKANWLAVQTSRANIDRSARSVEQARENLRIQLERSKQSLNTTADVLDAEALALQAETEALAAGYGWRVAREKLYDSLGR